MATKSKMKLYTMDQVKDEFIGKRSTDKREKYEQELQMELIGDNIKQVRLERNLTQLQLGKLIGVQKAQISKLENNTTNVTLETILTAEYDCCSAKEFAIQYCKIAENKRDSN